MGLFPSAPNNDCNSYSITDKTVEIFWKILGRGKSLQRSFLDEGLGSILIWDPEWQFPSLFIPSNCLSVLSVRPFWGLFPVWLPQKGRDVMFTGFARLLAAPFEIFSDFVSNFFGWSSLHFNERNSKEPWLDLIRALCVKHIFNRSP